MKKRVNQASLQVWCSPLSEEVRDTVMNRVLSFFDATYTNRGWTSCQVARALALDLLSVRPRLTQAVQEGNLVAIAGDLVDCQYCGKKNQRYLRPENARTS